MDYERKYKEALKKAKSIHSLLKDSDDGKNFSYAETIEDIFPELKETEDEKIREELIKYLKERSHSGFNREVRICNDGIAWLEKQSEQKPNDKVESEPYFYCKYGGTTPLCSNCKRNHSNSSFKTEEITTWYVPSKPPKHCIDYIVLSEKQGGKNEQNFWEKCNHCEYFDGYDICLHKYNFGTVTDETKENCKNNNFFLKKQREKANENNEEIPLSEQNPVDKVEPKFKVGDWIIGNTIYKVLCVIDDEYRLSLNIDDSIVCAKIKTIDKKFHLWSIQDAKDGDVLANKSGAIFINAGSSNERITLDCYCYLSLQNEFCIEEHKTGSWFYKEYITPATKEQRDLLFSKMKEAGYEWDAEKKELRKIEENHSTSVNEFDMEVERFCKECFITDANEKDRMFCVARHFVDWQKSRQKPAWSEEDENYENALISLINEIKNQPLIRLEDWDCYIDWLKSLKDRMKGE